MSITLDAPSTDLPPDLEYKSVATLDPQVSADHTMPGSTERLITAVIAVTGVRDEVGDTIIPGAFADTIRERPRPKVCLGHDWNRPIGKTRELKELLPGDPGLPEKTFDGRPWPKEAGALIAQWVPDETKDGIDAYNSAKFYGPEESTFSIGYKAVSKPDPAAKRFLHKVSVYEYGPVLIPAHPLATLQDVKANDAAELETKVKQVRDTAYWGEAYGTPITAHMHPHGPKARAERRAGRVPSRDVGTMAPGERQAAPEKVSNTQRQGEQAAAGLFPEPADGARVMPSTRAKGHDQQHIDAMAHEIAAGNADPDNEDADRAALDKAVRGLLDEAITPQEVRERLATHPAIEAAGGRRNYQSGEPGVHDAGIEHAAADYAARYAALAASQRAAQDREPTVPASRFTAMSNAQLAQHAAASSQIMTDLDQAGVGRSDKARQLAAANWRGAKDEQQRRFDAQAAHPAVGRAHQRGLAYNLAAPKDANRKADDMQMRLNRLEAQQREAPPEQGSMREALPHRMQAMIHGLRGLSLNGRDEVNGPSSGNRDDSAKLEAVTPSETGTPDDIAALTDGELAAEAARLRARQQGGKLTKAERERSSQVLAAMKGRNGDTGAWRDLMHQADLQREPGSETGGPVAPPARRARRSFPADYSDEELGAELEKAKRNALGFGNLPSGDKHRARIRTIESEQDRRADLARRTFPAHALSPQDYAAARDLASNRQFQRDRQDRENEQVEKTNAAIDQAEQVAANAPDTITEVPKGAELVGGGRLLLHDGNKAGWSLRTADGQAVLRGSSLFTHPSSTGRTTGKTARLKQAQIRDLADRVANITDANGNRIPTTHGNSAEWARGFRDAEGHNGQNAIAKVVQGFARDNGLHPSGAFDSQLRAAGRETRTDQPDAEGFYPRQQTGDLTPGDEVRLPDGSVHTLERIQTTPVAGTGGYVRPQDRQFDKTLHFTDGTSHDMGRYARSVDIRYQGGIGPTDPSRIQSPGMGFTSASNLGIRLDQLRPQDAEKSRQALEGTPEPGTRFIRPERPNDLNKYADQRPRAGRITNRVADVGGTTGRVVEYDDGTFDAITPNGMRQMDLSPSQDEINAVRRQWGLPDEGAAPPDASTSQDPGAHVPDAPVTRDEPSDETSAPTEPVLAPADLTKNTSRVRPGQIKVGDWVPMNDTGSTTDRQWARVARIDTPTQRRKRKLTGYAFHSDDGKVAAVGSNSYVQQPRGVGSPREAPPTEGAAPEAPAAEQAPIRPYQIVSKRDNRNAVVSYQGNQYKVHRNNANHLIITDPSGAQHTAPGGNTSDSVERALRSTLETAHDRYTGTQPPAIEQAGGADDRLGVNAARHANAIARMTPAETRDYLKGLPRNKIQAIDAELSNRAAALGHPGVLTSQHRAVREAEPSAEFGPLTNEDAAGILLHRQTEASARMRASGMDDREIARATDTSARSHVASLAETTQNSEHTEPIRSLLHQFAEGRQTGSAAALAEHDAGVLTPQQRSDRTAQARRTAQILGSSGVDQTGANDTAQREMFRYAEGLENPERARDRLGVSGEQRGVEQVTPQQTAELADLRDEALGLHEDDDGHLTVEPEVAQRQDRVEKLLADHEGGALDLTAKSTSELSGHRKDLDDELRLQTELARRPEAEPKPKAPREPRTAATRRPGLAGAAQDHAEAISSGDAEAIERTRARLESSVRRSRAGSDSARAIADHIGAGDADAENLARLADSLRAETRQRRNTAARARRTAKRLDRERIRSLLGNVDAELRNRGQSPGLTMIEGRPPVSGTRRITDGEPASEARQVAPTATAGMTPLTDEEYQAHTRSIETTLNREIAAGRTTDQMFTKGGKGKVYLPERAQMHKEIVDSIWNRSGANVPREGKAIIAGGLGGAGKSTVLAKHAGVDRSQYLTINPDDVKEEMIARGMTPNVEGLSPMESSPLSHEESSHIANLLAARAYKNKTNVIWDVTMSRRESVEKRLNEMAKHGYGKADAVFVDIPVETSVERALSRHRRGMERYRQGEGMGGRYVPPSIIRKMSHSSKSSANRDVYDQLKDRFGSTAVYDNSTFGQDPVKLEGTGRFGVADTGLPTIGPNDSEDVRRAKLTQHYQWLHEHAEQSHPSESAVEFSTRQAGAPTFISTFVRGGTPEEKAAVGAMWPKVREGTEHVRAPMARIADLSKVAPGNAAAAKLGTAANYTPHLGVISIDPKHVFNTVPRNDSDGFFSDSGDAGFNEATLHHEYGHHLDHELTAEQRNAMFRELGEALERHDDSIHGKQNRAYRARDIGNNIGPQDWVEANKDMIVNHIGTYAGETHLELPPELWTSFRRAKNPSEFAKIVGRHLSQREGRG